MSDGTDRDDGPSPRRLLRRRGSRLEQRSPPTSSPSRWRRWARRIALAASVLLIVTVVSIALASGFTTADAAVLGAVIAAAFGLLWLAMRLLRRLLWRVGRRLAFTYFLIGVLPIPMALLMLGVGAYLLGGFFLGHLFRDALAVVHQEVAAAAATRLDDPGTFASAPAVVSDVAFAYYFDGRRDSGDERSPVEWPAWLEQAVEVAASGIDRRDRIPPLVSLPDGSLSLAVAQRRGPFGVVAFFDGHLETRLRSLSGVWIELVPPGDPRGENVMDVTILGERFVFQPLSRERGAEDRRKFLERGMDDGGVWIHGFDVAGRLLSLASGEEVSDSLPASLVGTPGTLLPQLFSSSREVDTLAWLTFVLPAFLLFDVFAVAWIMALFMVFGLSRAVNQLSAATTALQHGDFSVRIPVRRTDQIGALHASFNNMAASLEALIATKAQKESLEKELKIARAVQESLLPKGLLETAEVEFATHFEPSAAIGGDYFDILRVDDARLAIVVADVSGHGLSAGLRMAMIKAALAILVEEEEEPASILRRLDRLLRASGDVQGGGFVTATLTFLDVEAARVEIVNAGHPPTYLLRGGKVEEILLPGSPLGALGTEYGSAAIDLAAGDALVWLSDGFIECTDPSGEVFGYDRTMSSLQGSSENPALVRDRLLDTVARYTGGRAPEDDRTLVVMRFRRARSLAAGADGGAARGVAEATRARIARR